MIEVALQDAVLFPSQGTEAISALAGLVRQYNTSNAIIMRLTRAVDAAALSAIMTGVTLDLTTQENAETSAETMSAAIDDPSVRIEVLSDVMFNFPHIFSMKR